MLIVTRNITHTSQLQVKRAALSTFLGSLCIAGRGLFFRKIKQ